MQKEKYTSTFQRLPLVMVAALSLTMSAPVLSAEGFSDKSNGGVNRNNPDWMSRLPDATPISQLSVLGTHDTPTWDVIDFNWIHIAKTQSMDIQRQLQAGVRAFDIRCQHKNNRCALRHGRYDLNKDLSEILDATTDFLSRNRGETIFMVMNNPNGNGSDGSPTGNTPADRDFTEAFYETYWRNARYYPYFWKGSTPNRNASYPQGSGDIFPSGQNKNLPELPSLKDVRGKIVVMQDFNEESARGWFGLPGPNSYEWRTRFANYINTDNLYTVPNPGAREEYWQKKKEVFNKISNPSLSASNVIQFHGISGAPTTAWAIGMDFNPENIARHVNVQANKYFKELALAPNTHHRVGLVMADYPDLNLIENVIALNYKAAGTVPHRFAIDFSDINDRIEVSVNGVDVFNFKDKAVQLPFVNAQRLRLGQNEIGIRLGNNDCFSTSLKVTLLVDGVAVDQQHFYKRTSHCGRQLSWKYNVDTVTGSWQRVE
ncbi:hypothetical protein QWZ03_16410 [Chitinimonas viridis]|uniref:1-phosphatidylinositol phosphodiesterase n=1 Tax=Chitinimonas viridis TaxID=664880 RepID=A0ABT8B9W8_9NEIS|nr:phosphatidylinositol-specific phospholipase C domain-containing protein [Chitinimonas viridis]MDN3578353.1 hypothetical protein [Chitinimonas viridis]